jgi:hypothetical protein
MGALGEGIGPDTDEGIRLCQLLDINPDDTHSISITLEAGTGAVLEWVGRRHVPMRRIVDALTDALDPNAGDTPDWIPGADPWGTPPAPPC